MNDLINGEEQIMAAVHYHHIMTHKPNDDAFYDQVGCVLWDFADDTVVETLTVTGDIMRCSETTVPDIYQKKSYDHKYLNTLQHQA